jgi:hypothetical protein
MIVSLLLVSIVTEIVAIPGRLVTPKTAALPAHSLPRCKRQVFQRVDDCDHLFGLCSNQHYTCAAL